MATRLPRSAAKSIASALCARRWRGRPAQDAWHPPFAGAVLPRREQHLTRVNCLAPTVCILHGRSQQLSRGRQIDERRAVAHAYVRDVAHPEQIIRPVLSSDQAESREMIGAVARLVPRLVRQARNIEIGTGVIFRAAQRRHAGIGAPRAFRTARGLVDDEHIVDPGPRQTEGRRDTGLAGADDEDIERRFAIRGDPRCKPRQFRMCDPREIGPDLRGQRNKRRARSVAHFGQTIGHRRDDFTGLS